MDHAVGCGYTKYFSIYQCICRDKLLTESKVILEIFSCLGEEIGIPSFFRAKLRPEGKFAVLRGTALGLRKQHTDTWDQTQNKEKSDIDHVSFFLHKFLLKSEINERIVRAARKT